MGFVKSKEWLMQRSAQRQSADFYDAELVTVFWETKPEIVAQLVPPPLKPTRRPLACAFIGTYPRTNFGVAYEESALFVLADYKGEEGLYCLAMHVTDDIALVAGREGCAYPKKMANITFKKSGNQVEAWAERKGVRLINIKSELDGQDDAPDLLSAYECIFKPNSASGATAFNFKHFPHPNKKKGFDYAPRLLREPVKFNPEVIQLGKTEFTLKSSPNDPWAEVEVVQLLGAVYSKGFNSMLDGEFVAEVDPLEFAPYAYLKWDV